MGRSPAKNRFSSSAGQLDDVCFGSLADILTSQRHVRFRSANPRQHGDRRARASGNRRRCPLPVSGTTYVGASPSVDHLTRRHEQGSSRLESQPREDSAFAYAADFADGLSFGGSQTSLANQAHITDSLGLLQRFSSSKILMLACPAQ